MKQFNNLREDTLLEKLKASDPTGKWISDFVHSDNPKFAGKSKKERIRMALGASYGAKRNEEVEQVDELSNSTLNSYVNKARNQVRASAGANPNNSHVGTDPKIANRARGAVKADNRLHGFGPVKKRAMQEAKEKTEYDYEGDMARGQLQSIINNAQRVHDMLKDNDNLPEWVQSKITLSEDYISTVANYMMSEIDEEVEQQDEGMMDTVKTVAKKVGKALTGGSDEDQLKNLQKKMGVPQTGKKPQMKEDADICPVCETDPCICDHGQHIEEEIIDEAKPGLYANIHAKRKRIASGSGERMRKPGSKGAPTAQAFKDAAKTVKEDSEVEEMVAPNAPVHTQLSFNNLRMKSDKKYVDKLKTAQGKTLPAKEKDTLH